MSILKYFKYDHLPEKLQQVSRPFCDLANVIDDIDGDCREKAVALRKLLESKDAAVRSALNPEAKRPESPFNSGIKNGKSDPVPPSS